MVKGIFAKRRGGLLLGKIIFDSDEISVKYLLEKKVYSAADIECINYTYYHLTDNSRCGGYVKYFHFAFKDNNEIFVLEKSNANSEDSCRNYIKTAYKEKFSNTELERLSDEVQFCKLKDIKKKRGCIQFWGEWFGGRCGEAPLNLKKYSIDNDLNKITLTFDEDETCEIFSPEKIYNSKIFFYIRQADKIVMIHYYYGREKSKENIIQTTYTKIKNQDKVHVLQIGALGERNEIIKIRNINALEF